MPDGFSGRATHVGPADPTAENAEPGNALLNVAPTPNLAFAQWLVVGQALARPWMAVRLPNRVFHSKLSIISKKVLKNSL